MTGERVDRMLEALWERRGTDVLLTVGMPPQIRVDGTLIPLDHPALTPQDTDALLAEVLTDAQRGAWEAGREYDFAFSWRERARVRQLKEKSYSRSASHAPR